MIRLLVNHPDVMLRTLCEPSCAGRDVNTLHHGLIGECSLKFADACDTSKLDVLFLTTREESLRVFVPDMKDAPELAVVDLCSDFADARAKDPFVVYGVPEANRKALVRGAKRACIPHVAEVVLTIALLPLALRSQLHGDINVRVELPETFADDRKCCVQNVSDIFALNGDEPAPRFHIDVITNASPRAVTVSLEIPMEWSMDDLMELYEELYDDHNMTHVVAKKVHMKEVEGTDRCIISLDKASDGNLQVTATADAFLRGGAGDALHVMNLLTGLYEKTGLALKASNF